MADDDFKVFTSTEWVKKNMVPPVIDKESRVMLQITAGNPSDWKVQLFGLGRYGIIICPERGSEPNWFWRWAQYLLVGNKWVRRL